MSAIDPLKAGILDECEQDHVGLWSIVRDVEEFLPQKDSSSVRDEVLKLLRELLVSKQIEAGFPTKDGKFDVLQVPPDKVLEQIASQWPAGRRPTIGEGLWFTRTKAG